MHCACLTLDGLSSTIVWGAALTTDHAQACPCGGYPIARHNEIRDLLAEVMWEVVKDVETEPTLLPYLFQWLTVECGDQEAAGSAESSSPHCLRCVHATLS